MKTPFLSLLIALAASLSGCGYKFGYRNFAGPILPIPAQAPEMRVGDDRSVTFSQDRLEVSLRPMTTEMLNRQFLNFSSSREKMYDNPYVYATNPYTYGNSKPRGEDRTPDRFTVFLLKVKNYRFPKVKIDPNNVEIIAKNGRHYRALSLDALVEYYWPYAVAYAGNNYTRFEERKDLLRQTLYEGREIFSGQEDQGYIVFPPLDQDVDDFTIWIGDMVLRFDFRNEPVETTQIPYRYQRELYRARRPRLEQ